MAGGYGKSRVESLAQGEARRGEARPQGVLILQVNVDDILIWQKREGALRKFAGPGGRGGKICSRRKRLSPYGCPEKKTRNYIPPGDIVGEVEELASSMGVKSSRETVEFWDILSSKLGEKGYQEVIGAVIEIREKAAETLRKETEVQKELEAHLEKLRSNLLKLNDGMRAFKAYTK